MAAMTSAELKTLKSKIKAEMTRRNGFGSLSTYGGSAYDFTVQPAAGGKILPEHGQKTIDLLLQIKDYSGLKLVKEDDPIPDAFNSNLITEVEKLAAETKTGQSAKTVANLFPTAKVETSSCRGDCTGLCVGTCISNCNGCTSCTATCGTGCASGCNSSCNTGCYTGCNTGCYKDAN
jgi:hypothetical protein